jgi:chemotaxis protein MotB
VSASDEETKAQELVIIRRHSGGEDGGHHGGVWKIAYADFMTAMMAFFLVMWLINSSDKQTLTQVATYFNPLRLTDKVALSKGMHQSDAVTQATEKASGNPKTPSGASKEAKDKHQASAKQQLGESEKSSPGAKQQQSGGKGESKAEGAKAKYTEEVLFRDPYGTLSKLAEQAAADQAQPAKGGEAFRDPFDPVFRREAQAEKQADKRESARPTPTPTPPAASGNAGQPAKESAAPSTAPPIADSKQSAEAKQGVDARQSPDAGQIADVKQGAEAKKSTDAAPTAPAEDTQAKKAAEEAARRAHAAKLERDIRDVVARAIAGALPNISVTVTEEGILISLTDDQNFGMFAIASAEPRPAMVVLMEKLGKVIAGYPEPLIVRGHTDGRPYKSGAYDNWRLSTARAHMAYYMLMRGGVDEKRFERIEGHADRNLKMSSDPEAAQNRRIEILLRKAKP